MRLVNLPKVLDSSAFDVTRDFVRTQYANISNLIEVVEFGTTNLPGISDVDLIAIIEAYSTVHMPSMEEIYRDERYAPMHKPFVYSSATFKRLRGIDPWIVHIHPLLKKTDGYSMEDVDALSEEEHRWFSLRFMLQWATTLLRLLASTHSAEAIPCHLYLGICIVPKYMYRELRRLNITKEDDENVPFYERIREEWFTLTPEQQGEQMHEGIDHLRASMRNVLKIIATYMSASTEQQPVPATCAQSGEATAICKRYPHSFVIDGDERVFVFQERRTEIEMEVETFSLPLLKKLGGKYNRTLFLFPLEIGALYAQYLQGKGPISAHVQRHSATDLQALPFAPSSVLQDFVDLTDQIVAESANVTAAKYFFETFGFEHPATVSLRQLPGAWCATLARTIARSPLGKLLGKRVCRCTLA
jgi:hypothetical protein